MGIEEYLLPTVVGAVGGGVTGTAIAGPAGTIPGVAVGALLGLLAKNLVFLLLIIPLFLVTGISSFFTQLPWYIWAVGVLLIIIILIKGK